MAIEPARDPLDRALAAAKQEEPEGWIELSDSIMSRVRSLVTPSEPVLAFTDDGSAEQDDVGSRTLVSARIVQAAVRRALRAPTHAPDDIELVVVDERLVEVVVSLVVSYGPDLVALAEEVRLQVHAAVADILGPDPEFTPASVSIDIGDVVVGDPNLV